MQPYHRARSTGETDGARIIVAGMISSLNLQVLASSEALQAD